MRSNQPDELDRLLDEALASYSSEEPRPGLEQRVVSRVRAEGDLRRFGWWRWAVAIPVFASLLVLAIGHRTRPQQGAVEHSLTSAPPAATAYVASTEPRHTVSERTHRVAGRSVTIRSPLPRRGVFPLPAPMSPGERALVDLVARFPDQAQKVLIQADARGIEPIEIQNIEIPPLPGGER